MKIIDSIPEIQAFAERAESCMAEKGQEVLNLLPIFDQLSHSEWDLLLDCADRRPQTTTLLESDEIRMLLIYWEGGKESSIHGHPEGGGLIKVLRGTLEETRYDPLSGRPIDTAQLDVGEMSYIHDVLALHQVRNSYTTPAISLHLYTGSRRKSA